MTDGGERVFDAIILGGGPAGLSAALVLGRARRSVLLIDGGQPRNQAARTINGYLGHDGIPPAEFRQRGHAEIARYGVTLRRDVAISAAAADKSKTSFATLFHIETQQGFAAIGRKLLFATGMRDELPDLSGARECYGISLHHCPYCDGWEHRDQRIAVYAQEPHEAVGLGLALSGWSKQVTVLTNGELLSVEDQSRLAHRDVKWRREPICRLVHEQGRLERIELKGDVALPAEAMFFESIQHPSCELTKSLGVTRDEPFNARTSREQKTNVPGVFIAGDADGNVEFVIVAAAEGATAAVAINRELLEEDLRQ